MRIGLKSLRAMKTRVVAILYSASESASSSFYVPIISVSRSVRRLPFLSILALADYREGRDAQPGGAHGISVTVSDGWSDFTGLG